MLKGIDKSRITTGILLIALVVVVALIDNLFLTWLVLGVAFIFSFIEAMNLYGIKDRALYYYAVALWLMALIYPNPDDLIFVALIVYVSDMVFNNKPEFKKIQPFAYPAASFLFLFALYVGFGIEALIWLVIIVALTDTAAYFVGKSIGKHQFCQISPNKTWEGVIGGVIIATVVGAWYGTGFVSAYLAVFVSFVVSVASIFGDLFESFLKRSAGVKDSGDILPGHGGVLDRMDGYMFASILMVILLRGLA